MRTKCFYLTLTGCLIFLAGFITTDVTHAKELTPSEVRQYVRSAYKAVKGTDAFLDGALNKAGPVEDLAWLEIFKLLITADKVIEAVQTGNYHKAIIVAGSYSAVEAALQTSKIAQTYSATYNMIQLAALPIELGLKSFNRAATENAWNYQMREYFAARKMGKSPNFIMAGKSDDDVLFDDFGWIYSVVADGGRKGLPQHLPAGYTPQNVYTAAEKLYKTSLLAQQFSSEREQLGGKFVVSLNSGGATSSAGKESVSKQECAKYQVFLDKYKNVPRPNIKKLAKNPFVYEGKTIITTARFKEMSSSTDGVFHNGDDKYFISGIPKGKFTGDSVRSILVVKVLGRKEATQSPNNRITFAIRMVHFKYLDSMAFINREHVYCEELVGKEK